MEWSDTGVILSARAHGEGHAVADILSPDQGRWAGLVYGGSGRSKSHILQPGNRVQALWRGRGEDSLGHFTLEVEDAVAARMLENRLALTALSAACTLAVLCLPDRERHPRVYAGLNILIDQFEDEEIWPALFAKWELGLLGDLGFGLTLDRCAATGAREELVYVSPRSACAVNREAGEPYKDRLLPLPPFLKGEAGEVSPSDALAALTTTGHFVETRILHLSNQTLPQARITMIELLERKLNR